MCSSSMQEAMGLSPWHQEIEVHSVIPGRRSREVQVEDQPDLEKLSLLLPKDIVSEGHIL